MSYLFSRALQIYKDINPSTLTGAIDIIVVSHPDGTLTCTPFHVRFGKLSVLRAAEKKVSLHLNGNADPLEFMMKVGEAGEAFFIFETDSEVPEEYQTSPLVIAKDEDGTVSPVMLPEAKDDADMDPEPLHLPVTASNSQFFPAVTSEVSHEIVDEDADDVDDEESNRAMSASESGSGWKTARTSPTTPASGLPRSAGGASGRWPIGGMSMGMTAIDTAPHPDAPSLIHADKGTRNDDELSGAIPLDLTGYKDPTDQSEGSLLNTSENTHKSAPKSQPLESSTSVSKMLHMPSTQSSKPEDYLRSFHAKLVSRNLSASDIVSRGDTDETYTWGWGELPMPSPSVERTQFTHPYPSMEHELFSSPKSAIARPQSSLLSLSTSTELSKGFSDTDFVIKSASDSQTFQISLSGPNIDNNSFSKAQVGFASFMADPTIADSPDLVIRHQGDCITWSDSAHILAALLNYRQSVQSSCISNRGPLQHSLSAKTVPSASSVDPSKRPPNPSTTGSWSKWWKGSQSDPDLHASLAQADAQSSAIVASTSVPDDQGTVNRKPDDHVHVSNSTQKTYAKTLRLSSHQLKTLNLRKGPNQISFSVTSSYSGVAVASARIFMWDDDDQIVVSDIDGTITKSDALGHVFNMIGRDWTHMGVAKLYTDIVQNGYKIMYLTSRAIGQADSTREYLKGIKQDHYQLPDGPVIMSPDRLITSLHREVIMRKPEVFKMACLRDVERVFQRPLPFYAGFGNRITDALSYRSVHIPSSRIFTIDSGGEVKMELLELVGYKSSYIHMNELVAYWFPPVQRLFAPEFGDFNFWRSSLPSVQFPDLSPPSPTLSARSETSGRFSMLRFGSSSRKNSESSNTPRPSSSANNKGRPGSPLGAAAMSSDIELSEDEYSGPEDYNEFGGKRSRRNSNMPGSLPPSFDQDFNYDEETNFRVAEPDDKTVDELAIAQISLGDLDDQTRELDENLRAADEMDRIPFL